MNFDIIAEKTISIILPTLLSIKNGALDSIGSDIWKLTKKVFQKDENDKKIIASLEKNPDDLRVQGKVEFRLAQLLEKNTEIAAGLSEYIKSCQKESFNENNFQVTRSKNVVSGNIINLQDGDFTVGDIK